MPLLVVKKVVDLAMDHVTYEGLLRSMGWHPEWRECIHRAADRLFNPAFTPVDVRVLRFLRMPGRFSFDPNCFYVVATEIFKLHNGTRLKVWREAQKLGFPPNRGEFQFRVCYDRFAIVNWSPRVNWQANRFMLY